MWKTWVEIGSNPHERSLQHGRMFRGNVDCAQGRTTSLVVAVRLTTEMSVANQLGTHHDPG